MKREAAVACITWTLERLMPRRYSSAVAGDLLEELHAGRPLSWYGRQVASAIAVGLCSRSRKYWLPVSFSAGWSMLYPAWQFSVGKLECAQHFFNRSSSLGWPYSNSMEVGRAVFPAITFIWAGCLLYFLLRMPLRREHAVLRVAGSFSVSFNVLLLATVSLCGPLGRGSNPLGPVSLHLSSAYFAKSLPLFLSLVSAVLVSSYSATKPACRSLNT